MDGPAPIVVERRSETARRWPGPHLLIAGTVAAAFVAIVAGALVLATRTERIEVIVPAAAPTTVDPALAAGSLAAQEDDAPQPPTAVSACNMPGPQVDPGTEEEVVVSLPEGEMTIHQGRGTTWSQTLTSVTDPRLSGTVHHPGNWDAYTVPGEAGSPEFGMFTKRIENEDGAWQGSAVQLKLADGTLYTAPLVMTGEGAYEGLTAIVAFVDFGDDCTIEGYIIDGTIPEAPVPQTGQ